MLSERTQLLQLNYALEDAFTTERDPLSREVFGILGLPIDALELPSVVRLVDEAIDVGRPFLISTPNINFLIQSLNDARFRETVLLSDLCPADGMPVVWIARLFGVKLSGTVSGADIFSALKCRGEHGHRRSVFLFGGADDAAAQVAQSLNTDSLGLKCVGAFNPGFGTVEEMSQPEVIDKINSSDADLLAVFFNAKKAQSWLCANHDRLSVPVRAQFGATINFEAGIVKRAPRFLRQAGFEWLWRIKEEPYLWRRYWNDGLALARLFWANVLPFALYDRRARLRAGRCPYISIVVDDNAQYVRVKLSGEAIRENISAVTEAFRSALRLEKPIVVDLQTTEMVDARFFGLLLMVRKQLNRRSMGLRFVEAPSTIRRAFQLNGFDFLLKQDS